MFDVFIWVAFCGIYANSVQKGTSEAHFLHLFRLFAPFLLAFCYFCPAIRVPMHLTSAIIADFKAGRLASFYAEAYAPLLTYAARVLGEQYALLAEDCVQDAIFASYQRRADISDPLQWKTFLFRAVHNGAVSILRHHRAQQNYLKEQSDVEDDFTRSLIEQETLDTLFSGIRALPDRYRRIFSLSFEQGLRNTEIARLLSISTRAVTKQKARLVELLRQRL